MSKWKDEDIATSELILDYLQEFKEGIANNPHCQLDEKEKARVDEALASTEKFCLGLVSRRSQLYMHDLILMAVGFYGGYLTALDSRKEQG